MSESAAVARTGARAALESLPVGERAAIRRQALEELEEIVGAQAKLAADSHARGSTSAARFVAEVAGLLKSGAIPRDIAGEKLKMTSDLFFATLVAELGEERAGTVWSGIASRYAEIWGDV